jgi:anti-sigma B factor antagonist
LKITKSNIEILNLQFTVIKIEEGELGLSDSKELKSSIENELVSGNTNIAIDLSNLSTINSIGLGILISCLKLVKTANGNFKLIKANEKIISILKITKLNLVFEI